MGRRSGAAASTTEATTDCGIVQIALLRGNGYSNLTVSAGALTKHVWNIKIIIFTFPDVKRSNGKDMLSPDFVVYFGSQTFLGSQVPSIHQANLSTWFYCVPHWSQELTRNYISPNYYRLRFNCNLWGVGCKVWKVQLLPNKDCNNRIKWKHAKKFAKIWLCFHSKT